MPQFRAGESKNAIINLTNPTAKGFQYNTKLYFGIEQASLVSKDVLLDPGQTKPVELPVVMPQVNGIYPVYFDVYVGNELLKHYRADDDLTIIPNVVPINVYDRFRVTEISGKKFVSAGQGQYLSANGQYANSNIPIGVAESPIVVPAPVGPAVTFINAGVDPPDYLSWDEYIMWGFWFVMLPTWDNGYWVDSETPGEPGYWWYPQAPVFMSLQRKYGPGVSKQPALGSTYTADQGWFVQTGGTYEPGLYDGLFGIWVSGTGAGDLYFWRFQDYFIVKNLFQVTGSGRM